MWLIVWASGDLVITPLGFLDTESIVTFMFGIGWALDSWAVFDSVGTLTTFALDHTLWTGVD